MSSLKRKLIFNFKKSFNKIIKIEKEISFVNSKKTFQKKCTFVTVFLLRFCNEKATKKKKQEEEEKYVFLLT